MATWVSRMVLRAGPAARRRRATTFFSLRAWKHDLSSIRNVGIIAHIDAGKTTTTERMLHYAGLTKTVGEVHDGDTVTDYMDAERERGITITAAAITLPWKTAGRPFVINLIDTPGHVDFTIEVERALRVLDGGLVILDGSAGVQAQTLTVWRQAERNFRLPRIVYLNKMDKPNADLGMCLRSIRDKLDCQPILVQAPVGTGKSFRGVVDLVSYRLLSWRPGPDDPSHGKAFTSTKVEDSDMKEEAAEARSRLVESLCDWDDQLADEVLSNDWEDYRLVPEDALRRSVRRTVANHPGRVAITLLGSSYKNVGVQPLMDAVTSYLPQPSTPSPTSTFRGTAFKIVHPVQSKAQQKAGSAYTFLRVYGGRLKEGDSVRNRRTGTVEKVSRLFLAFADDFKPVSSIDAGQIGVATGLKTSATGDALVDPKDCGGDGDDDAPPLEVPDPVLFATIEPGSASELKTLELALANLSREDPSLRVDVGEGEITVAGMGELHLDVVLDRIRREYKIEADLGPYMISYRETIGEPSAGAFEFDRSLLDRKMRVSMEMEVEPSGEEEEKKPPELRLLLEEEQQQLRPWQQKAIRRGFENAVSNGPMLGFPMANFRCTVRSVRLTDGSSNAADTIVAAATEDAVKRSCEKAGIRLLEPVMKLGITSDPELMRGVVQELLARRRGRLVDESFGTHVATATVMAPMAELRGYATHIRSAASGRAFFGMEFDHYAGMSDAAQAEAVKEVTGF